MATVVNRPHRNHKPTEHRMIDLGWTLVCACLCPLCTDKDGECICPQCTGHWPTDGSPVEMVAA